MNTVSSSSMLDDMEEVLKTLFGSLCEITPEGIDVCVDPGAPASALPPLISEFLAIV